MKVANWIMTAAFLLSVLVQYNDPDPFSWMAIYGVAMVSCLLYLRRKYFWPLFALIGLIALTLAALFAPGVLGQVALPELFAQWEMKDERVEVAREMGGLLIVAVWMTVLAVSSFRRKKAVTDAAVQGAL